MEECKKKTSKQWTKYDDKYKSKEINIGHYVRLHMLATKPGLKYKLRSDIWAGQYQVLGKLPNGNLKLHTHKKMPYIVHPNRVKPAEPLFEQFKNETKTKKMSRLKVSFNNELIYI